MFVIYSFHSCIYNYRLPKPAFVALIPRPSPPVHL